LVAYTRANGVSVAFQLTVVLLEILQLPEKKMRVL
jgi:hypothetical protein